MVIDRTDDGRWVLTLTRGEVRLFQVAIERLAREAGHTRYAGRPSPKLLRVEQRALAALEALGVVKKRCREEHVHTTWPERSRCLSDAGHQDAHRDRQGHAWETGVVVRGPWRPWSAVDGYDDAS